jgi:hypothetical protein
MVSNQTLLPPTTYPEANGDYKDQLAQYLDFKGMRQNLHMGVTPTSGAETPAYNPYS